MALSALSSLDYTENGANGTSLTSGTVSPTANALLVVFFSAAAHASALSSSVSDTLTGTGSWTLVEVKETAANDLCCGIAYAIAGSSPGSGTVTITWTESVTKRNISVSECTGHDTTTPVQQNKSNTSTGASITVTLDSTPASTSMVAGVMVDYETGGNPTNGTGFTELYNDASTTGGGFWTWVDGQYDLASADTTCDWSGLNSVGSCAIAIEINEATGGVTVTPAAVSGVASSVAPTVVLGSLSITPTARTSVASSVAPTVVLGSLSITPTADSAIASTVDPTVVLGSLSITPAADSAIASTVDPTVIGGGGVTVTPAAISAIAGTVAPTVVLGSLSIAPTADSAIASTVDPTVVLGSLSIAPAASTARAVAGGVTVVAGSISITPTAGYAIARARPQTGAGVVLGSTTATPSPVTGVVTSVVGAIIAGTAVRYDVTIEDSAVWSADLVDSAVWSAALTDSAIWSVALLDEQYDDAV